VGYIDLTKARAQMTALGLEALLVTLPENFTYVTGFGSLLANMWYEAGVPTAWALVPVGDEPLAVVVCEPELGGVKAASGIGDARAYPIWVDMDQVSAEQATEPDIRAALRSAPSAQAKPIQRPGCFEPQLILGLVTDLLRERGLLKARIGIELDFISQRSFSLLQPWLPGVQFADGQGLLRELRLVKTSQEIEHLRAATWLAEQGILAATQGITENTRHGEIRVRYQTGAAEAVQRRPGLSGFQGGGASVRVGPKPWVSTPDATVKLGDQIMFDCGTVVSGYHSDIGRVFTHGKATAAQKQIQAALVHAHDVARQAMRPGNRFCDVFQAGIRAMHEAGFGTYRRGHLGHSVGLYVLEEGPYICATEVHPIEPGMVLALEAPWYIDGIGGFQCEDNILVTENSNESFNELTRELVEI
jgi:Xaa-Pro aminopeptidase